MVVFISAGRERESVLGLSEIYINVLDTLCRKIDSKLNFPLTLPEDDSASVCMTFRSVTFKAI